MTYKGKPFKAGDFVKDMEATILESAKEQLRENFSSIRHPVTGEFPTVLVLGDQLDDLRLKIEGSPELLEIVNQRIAPEDRDGIEMTVRAAPSTPKVFLSYAFDDSELAKRIADALMAKGIDVWWAGWEMRAGDSLRQRIDEGLTDCTHFIVLLTPAAMKKPWVQQEMDAGLVRRISGQARFIALRHGISPRELPPLLSGMLSPEVNQADFDAGIRDLTNDIHGLSKKPALGPAPNTVSLPATGYTKTATAIAKIFVERTKSALFGDPQLGTDDLAEEIGVSVEDIEDAVHELRDMVTFSFDRVLPKTELFATFDKHFQDWSPEDDAIRLAADLVNDPSLPHMTEDLATHYGWDRRRMNPALCYLMSRKLIVDYKTLGNDWYSFRVVATSDTRRFVKSRS